MQWLTDLLVGAGTEKTMVAHAVIIFSMVAGLGLAIGAIRFFGISLGIAGVLFAGLAFGHFGLAVDKHILEFAREFGLILFVYTIGIQVGPGFMASLKKQGLPLNLMAAAIVTLGAITTLGVFFVAMPKNELPAAVGLFSGATTNTPSLAASGQALRDSVEDKVRAGEITEEEGAAITAMPALGYAVAYPYGVMGIILTMLLIRGVFKINTKKEEDLLRQLNGDNSDGLAVANLQVTNPAIDGLTLAKLPTLRESGITVSRILQDNNPRVARHDTVVRHGDVLLAVGPTTAIDNLKCVVGAESDVDLRSMPSHITTKRILVTKGQPVGKSVPELRLPERFGVTVTRINRAGVDIPAASTTKLQLGDNLVVVGDEDAIKRVADEFGDSPKKLNHPQVIPVFVGIVLGVLLGSIPIPLPGFPAPVKLGLAGGPLVVAILLSRIHKIGPLTWYMPLSANFMLREVGIVLFLAAVGLHSGHSFIETLTEGNGLMWMGLGVLITSVPLLVVAFFARIVLKTNYMSLCGLLAGSMTDPPALAFAGQMTGSEAPSVAYATVYPLVMILRILYAQAIILFFFR